MRLHRFVGKVQKDLHKYLKSTTLRKMRKAYFFKVKLLLRKENEEK